MKIHNYSAGPCILPQEVFEQCAEAVLNFNGKGLSILEISHRTKDFEAVVDEAVALVKEILNVPEGYSVIFLQGGASLGFLISAYNFMKVGGKAAYSNTGSWAALAAKEAKLLGDIIEVSSSKNDNYTHIPKNFVIPSDADYYHYTSNNTIFGTQYKNIPASSVPIICDMSSDIFSKPIDVSKYALIYAGAQKNLGPAGSVLYIVKDELLGKTGRQIPAMLDLELQASKGSMYNTPPVFSIYAAMLTLRWMKKNGGMLWMEARNNAKASLLYNEVDRNSMFRGTAAKEDRSVMNATFVLNDDSKTAEFDAIWKAAGISGITGHRSVGGYRASMYNALPLESVQVLVDCMQEFERKFA
jgi:phosphoserine aminotransferase